MSWKRITLWAAGVVAGIIVLVVLSVLALLHSSRFHQYVLNRAGELVSASLGTQVDARSFSVSLSNLSIALQGVRVLGANGHPSPPLLEADHLGMRFKILSIVRREWRLESVVLDHPVMHVLMDAGGNTNIPKPPPGGSQTDIFQLAVQHAAINRGEVYYNDRKSTINASLHDLQFESRFDNAASRYYGTLSYRDGEFQQDGTNAIPHSLKARFNATPQRFTLEPAVLTSGASTLAISATLENYSQPRVHARYEALVDTGAFRRALRNPNLPTGTVRLSGTLRYESVPGRPPLQSVSLDGNISSPALQMATSSVRTVIRDAGAKFGLANGNAVLQDVHARLLGGELNGALSMQDLGGKTASRLTANLRGISASELRQAAGVSLQKVELNGNIGAAIEATWGRTLDNLVATGDADLNATLRAASAPPGAGPTPITASLHGRFDARTKEITLRESYLRMPATSLLLNGTVSKRSTLQVRVQSANLHELEIVAASFQQSPQPLELRGQATFTGEVRGTTANPQVTGELQATNLRVRGTAWRLLRADVSLGPSGAAVQNGILQSVGWGRMTFDLQTELRRWSFTPQSAFTLKTNISQLQLDELARAANLGHPVSGVLSANVSVHGSQSNPSGQGVITLKQAELGGEPVQAVEIRFRGTGTAVNADLSMRLPAGMATGRVTYFPKEQGYEGALRAANLRLEQLQALKRRRLPITGLLDVEASGRGTLQNPEADVVISTPQLQIERNTINRMKLNATLRQHVATITLDSQAADAYIRGRGTVQMQGDYEARAELNSSVIPLQPLLAAYGPAQQAREMTGKTEIHATMQGALKRPAELNAELVVPVLALHYRNLEIGAANPIRAEYRDGVLRLQQAELRGTGTELRAQGTIPLRGTEPASLTATGTVNLELIKLLQPDVESAGELRFDLHSAGTLAQPGIRGQVQLVNARLTTEAVPLGIQNGNGILDVGANRIQIRQMQAQVGGGTVQVSGGIIYRPSLQFDLALNAKGVRLLYPEGVRSQLDSNLTLTGAGTAGLMSGNIRIAALSFTPDFDLPTFMNQFSGEVAPPPTQGLMQNLRLDINLQTATGVNLVSRTLSLQGNANLNVLGTAPNPVITGRANLTGGDLIFLANRYVIQGGTVDFINPVRTQPIVNLRANTTISQYDINLTFQGPFDHLRTTYTSNPSLPPADIIRLIATGKTESSAQAAAATPPVLGAESLLVSGLSGELTSRVAKIAGISQLSINPNIGGSAVGTRRPGPTIAVQQRVTSKLFVSFTTDLTSTLNQQIEVQYAISPRWAVSATRDQNGGFGFDALYHKQF